ncbi:tyrosine-type recombinase/integrase [Clostridium taeniosporum]|nr:tyrosine-type recombinase/integrase [Clostridium taeniosporum]
MRVETVISKQIKRRYILIDDNGEIVEPVLKFLKYRDNIGNARNTLRAYCYHLKLYFEFLNQINVNYLNIDIDQMAKFIGWLQTPEGVYNVSYLNIQESKRNNRTINTIINTVLLFYDYLLRHDESQISILGNLKEKMSYSKRGYKDFLYHINKDKGFMANIIKLKVPKSKPKTLDKQQIQTILNNCTNVRDYFLLRLLWESSIRIGEALSLWIEDFNISETKIEIKDRGELENYSEIKTVNSPRCIDVSCELMNDFMNYIAEMHDDNVNTNFVFIKLTGINKYKPMEYQDVVSLFNRLKKKTKIDVNPHMLRHSSLTELKRLGWEAEFLRIRAGHKHIQTTLQMYIHLSDDDLRKEWEEVEKNMKIKSNRSDTSEFE